MKKKEPDFIVMQCERNVNQIQNDVQVVQKEIVDFRTEIIKILNFRIFDEGELEKYQYVNKQKSLYENYIDINEQNISFQRTNNSQQQQSSQQQLQVKNKSPIKNKNNDSLQKNSNSKDQLNQLTQKNESGRNSFPWVEQIRQGIFDSYKVYDVLHTKANHSHVQELFDKKANKMIVGKLMDITNNMKKQLVYLVVSQNQLIRSFKNLNESSGQNQNAKEENRHKREIELSSLLRQNTKLLVWISSQDLEQDQQFVKKLKEKNSVTVDFNMMEQMVEEVFQRYQQLNKLFQKQPNVKYTQEEIKLLDNFVKDIIPNRQLSLHEIKTIDIDENNECIESALNSQHIKSSKKIIEKARTNNDLLNNQQEFNFEKNELRNDIIHQQSLLNGENNTNINDQQNNKSIKNKTRISLTDRKEKQCKSQHVSHQNIQNEEEENLFVKQIQKDTQLIKDSLSTLITQDGYTKIYISQDEAEQIKKESKYLKSSSTFISKKASTVSTARSHQKKIKNGKMNSTESQESIQFIDLLTQFNNKSQEQKHNNSNIVVKNSNKNKFSKRYKQSHNLNGQINRLNLSTQYQKTIEFDDMNNEQNNMNQSYTDSFANQSLDLNAQYCRKNKNYEQLEGRCKKGHSQSEQNTPRNMNILNRYIKQQNYHQKYNQVSSYDITDY